MKKLIMALGVVALAATVQAATFRWYQGSPVSPSDDATGQISSGTLYLFAGSGQSDLLTGYVAAIAASTSAADYLTGASGYVGSGALSSSTKFASTTVAGASVTSGRVVWSETTTDTSRSYFQVLVDGDNIYISDTITTGVAGTGNTNFAFANNESRSAIKQASDGYAGGGWYAVPEPTSGLLMLLGMAGLALKRKRA